MSKHVIYEGQSDFQVFDASDFKKADIEGGRKTTFPHGQAVEVEDDIADALTSKDGIFGDFQFREAEDNEIPETKRSSSDDEGDPKGSGDGASTEGTANAGAAGNTGRGSTGKGRSTGRGTTT